MIFVFWPFLLDSDIFESLLSVIEGCLLNLSKGTRDALIADLLLSTNNVVLASTMSLLIDDRLA
jgi:hypothetical protein